MQGSTTVLSDESKMWRWVVLPTMLLALSCGAPNVIHTALRGDLATLKRQIHERQQAGTLNDTLVGELATAVAGRELRSAVGNAAIRRIRQVRGCAGPLVPVLADRAEQLDDAGAEAALLLFEINRRLDSALVERYAVASSGAWRAVAARATRASRYGNFRRQFIRDADQRVRRAALRAAGEAASLDDLEAVLEAAQLDPDALSRSLAVRAAGAIGGQRATLALKDYWPRAQETTRMMIVEGWALPAAYRAGGRERLIWAAETESALPAIAAAGALVRLGGTTAALGAAVLARAIKAGTQAERRLAIRLGDLSDQAVLAASKAASKDDDRKARVMALARLVGVERERVAAITGLRELSKGKDRIAVEARAARAAAGDSSVTPQLLTQLQRGSSHQRRVAALGLLQLGRLSSAATALADDDPAVRTAVACSVVIAAR